MFPNNLNSRQLFQNLMQIDGGGGGNIKAPMGREGILNSLNNEDDTVNDKITNENTDDLELNENIDDDTIKDDVTGKEKDDKDDKEEEDDDEVDELKELEDELKEPTAEDLELTTPVKKREILAKYPNIFKDFPSLEKSYYRELAYTRLLPTIDDAKEAVQAVQILDSFEADLKEGKTVDLFTAVLKDDPQAFAKIADSYMENLAQVDERAYHHVLGNITKDIVTQMIRVGRSKENKELQDSATTLYQFMFGDVEWKPKQKLAIDDNSRESEEAKQLAKEKQDWESSKYNERQTELMTGVDNRIKSVIDSNIDKKSQMTAFVKKNATKEVKEQLDNLIKKDTRFQAIITKLWEVAKNSKYSQDSLQKIESAHVAKAKSLLPTVIISVKREALKENSVNRKRNITKEDDETIETTSRNSTTPRSRVDSTDKEYRNKPKPGESSLDFLNR